MKRDMALIPLSHEHQSALMLAYRLIHGRSSNPKYPWPQDPREQRELIIQMYESELKWHFQVEEDYIFAPYSERPELTEIIHNLLSEHRQMEHLIEQMKQAEGSEFSQILKRFGTLLQEHVHREERQLFEALQRHLTPEEIQKIGQQIQQIYSQRPDYFSIFTGEKIELSF